MTRNVAVYIAPAGLVNQTFDSMTWLDITDAVWLDSIEITVGVEDERDTGGPNELKLTLDTTDGRFGFGESSLGLSPRTPIRVVAWPDSFGYTRFEGYVDGWPVTSAGNLHTAQISAVSQLAVLGRDTLGPWTTEVLNRLSFEHWALDQPQGATTWRSAGRTTLGPLSVSTVDTNIGTVSGGGESTSLIDTNTSASFTGGNYTDSGTRASSPRLSTDLQTTTLFWGFDDLDHSLDGVTLTGAFSVTSDDGSDPATPRYLAELDIPLGGSIRTLVCRVELIMSTVSSPGGDVPAVQVQAVVGELFAGVTAFSLDLLLTRDAPYAFALTVDRDDGTATLRVVGHGVDTSIDNTTPWWSSTIHAEYPWQPRRVALGGNGFTGRVANVALFRGAATRPVATDPATGAALDVTDVFEAAYLGGWDRHGWIPWFAGLPVKTGVTGSTGRPAPASEPIRTADSTGADALHRMCASRGGIAWDDPVSGALLLSSIHAQTVDLHRTGYPSNVLQYYRWSSTAPGSGWPHVGPVQLDLAVNGDADPAWSFDTGSITNRVTVTGPSATLVSNDETSVNQYGAIGRSIDSNGYDLTANQLVGDVCRYQYAWPKPRIGSVDVWIGWPATPPTYLTDLLTGSYEPWILTQMLAIIQITNLPSVAPLGSLFQVVGYTERISEKDWTATLKLASWRPWEQLGLVTNPAMLVGSTYVGF